MRIRRTATLVVLAPVLLLPACRDGDSPTLSSGATSSSTAVPTRSPTASATATAGATATATASAPADEAAGGPAFPGDLVEQTSSSSGNGLSVTDVRVGRHGDYDRVVFQLGGTGTVGWRVTYSDDPRTEGEGKPVTLDGDATLTVTVLGLGYPQDTGQTEYAGPRLLSPQLPEVRQVQVSGVFEGQSTQFVGVTTKRPFRVFRLDSPQRLVLDVQH